MRLYLYSVVYRVPTVWSRNVLAISEKGTIEVLAVTIAVVLVAGMLLSWLAILRIHNPQFNTWLLLTELLTVSLFSLLIYFRRTYWWA